MKHTIKALPKEPDLLKQNSKLIIAFLLGSALTIGLVKASMLLAKKSSYTITKSTNSHQKKSTKQDYSRKNYNFINPLAEDPFYKKMNTDDLCSIKSVINNYINNTAKRAGVQVAFYLRDLNSDKTIGIGENTRFGPASLMKVPTLIATLKMAESNPSILNDKVLYKESKEASVAHFIVDKAADTPMVTGNYYTVEDLLKLMIMNSDNEATILLLDYLRLEYVEKVEKDLGFVLPTDIPAYGEVMTLKQYSSFFRTLYNASYLSNEYSNKALELLSTSRFKKGIRRLVPSEIQISHKFGSYFNYDDRMHIINQQLHHFGIVYFPGKPYIIGVMTKAKDQYACEKAIAEISKIVYDEVSKNVNSRPFNYLKRDID